MLLRFAVSRHALVAASLCALLLAVQGASAQVNERVKSLERAASLVGSDQLAEAERLLGQILKAAPEEAAALNLLGAIRAQQGRLDDAGALFARAVRADERLTGARMNLAHLHLLRR
ncbi:MAG TPA: tetratricopeptide repeat protein, partial [Pyrinomonadaceae bacterium]|nr:tetratricopeptide repeat protein [Pyrinomonadaceae bacterium]